MSVKKDIFILYFVPSSASGFVCPFLSAVMVFLPALSPPRLLSHTRCSLLSQRLWLSPLCLESSVREPERANGYVGVSADDGCELGSEAERCRETEMISECVNGPCSVRPWFFPGLSLTRSFCLRCYGRSLACYQKDKGGRMLDMHLLPWLLGAHPCWYESKCQCWCRLPPCWALSHQDALCWLEKGHECEFSVWPFWPLRGLFPLCPTKLQRNRKQLFLLCFHLLPFFSC